MSKQVAVSGASGLIGSALCSELERRGDRVLRLVRRNPVASDEVLWDWTEGHFEAQKLEGVDAVVHLAGRAIAARWTPATMREIRESRTRGTALLANGLASLRSPPAVLVGASAIGFYGDGRGRRLDDSTPRGEGWLAELCEAWETAALPAAAAGIRVALPRIGIVLSPDGGALKVMLPAFRLGVAGRLGDGRQGMSWIARSDLVRIVLHALDTPEVSGPFNATAPNPVSNAEFTRTLGRVLQRPTLLPLPAFVVATIWGEMGRRLMLDGDFIRPTRLAETGFTFGHTMLESALRHELDLT